MTRKDYILIAEALNAALTLFSPDDRRKAYIGWYSAASHVADALARDNPRFDRERFLKACGVQS